MKKILLLVLLVSALFFGFERLSETQTKPENAQTEQDKNKTKIVAFKPDEPRELSYDGGTARFLVNSEDTNGAWSVVELTEKFTYKTPLHRHNDWDESFYVLEGVLTIKIGDKTSEYPAGSYVLIPRGTPHAQGNFEKVPLKMLLTITPSGFERHLKDRVELFKTVKPDNPEFPKKLDGLRKKNAKFIEFLGAWDYQK